MIGEFSTTAPAQLQGFKKLQGTTGRAGKSAKNSLKNKKLREFFRGKAPPFQRKSATVSAQNTPKSATVSARITSDIPCSLWIRLAYAFSQKGGRKKEP